MCGAPVCIYIVCIDWLALARSLGRSLACLLIRLLYHHEHSVSVNACKFPCMAFFDAASRLRLSGSTVVLLNIVVGISFVRFADVCCVSLAPALFLLFLVMLLQIFCMEIYFCKAIHKRNDQD